MDLESKLFQKQGIDSDEEENDDVQFQPMTNLMFKTDKNQGTQLELLTVSKIQVETIFLGENGHGAAFLLSKLNKMTLFGYIYDDTLRMAEIYGTSDNKTVFIIFQEVLASTIYSEFSKFIFEKFNSQSIVYIGTGKTSQIPKNPYEVNFETTTRHIYSAAAKNSQLIGKPLEEATPVLGVPADLLVYSEINNIRTEVYFLYSQEYDIIADDVKHLDILVQKYPQLSLQIDIKDLASICKRVDSRMSHKACFL